MALIQIHNLKKSFGGDTLFDSLNGRIFHHSKIGLVGENGCGKTTLFKILMGKMEADAGEVIQGNNLNIQYFSQNIDVNDQHTVLEEALSNYQELQRQEQKLEELTLQMGDASPQKLEQLIEEQDALRVAFEEAGGYSYRARTEAVLEGLGFTKEMFALSVGKLSGGQKNRLALARILTSQADLILMDEPTNFLDVANIEWLENELKENQRAYLIISHDRYFLNQIAEEIWELSHHNICVYKGNFDQFEAAKQERLEQWKKDYQLQQAEIQRQEEFIRRNIGSQKTQQAKSRRKMLEKMDRLQAPPEQTRQMKITLAPSSSPGDKILEAKNLGHSFGEKVLFQNLSFALYPEEKLAIIGPNGCGKSTLLHIIAEHIAPTTGQVKLGEKVKLGFYHQQLEDLEPNKTVFDNIKSLVPTRDDGPIQDYLARFLFHGEEMHREVAQLSGGEKSKLALARLIIQEPNFLILDEPTNHLDIPSQKALENALANYQGTILFVSHDRYFINQVATRLLYYHDHGWIDFYGNYETFLSSKKEVLPATSESKKKRNKYLQFQQNSRKKPKYTFAQLEEKIIEGETRLEKLSAQMAEEDVLRDGEKMRQLKTEYDHLSQNLSQWNEIWENWE